MSLRYQLMGCLLLAGVIGGCSRGIKESVYALTGSTGKAVLLQGRETAGTLAATYGTVRVEPFSNDVGDNCPPEFLAHLPAAIEEQLRYRDPSFKERITAKAKEELGPFLTGPAEKTLVIHGRVIQYDIGGTADKVAGPLDEAICRIQVSDSTSGTQLVEANCTGRVKSSLRTGPKELAEGVGKGIRDLLKPDKD